MTLKLSQDAQTAVETITALGGHALLVGGFVRDRLLSIESKDIDIEIHGGVDADALIKALATQGRVDTVGRAFGVIKFGQDVDLSFPRRDSKVGDGHTGFEIEVDATMTIEEALRRRDFTINSIALDPVTGEIIDPFKGQLDLISHTIRHTDDSTFADDPLRVLRGVQFASRFGFVFASKTARLAQEIAHRFEELSVERVWVEWEKILTKGQSMQAVTEALIDTGWIQHFPEWGASARVTDRIVRRSGLTGEDRAILILGAQFAGREESLKTFLKRIDAPIWLRRASVLVATRHDFRTKDPALEARLISRITGRGLFDLWLQAHQLTDKPISRQRLAEPALLTGDDLIRLGRKPGPDFGTTLKAALQAQDLEGWTEKEEALAWLAR